MSLLSTLLQLRDEAIILVADDALALIDATASPALVTALVVAAVVVAATSPTATSLILVVSSAVLVITAVHVTSLIRVRLLVAHVGELLVRRFLSVMRLGSDILTDLFLTIARDEFEHHFDSEFLRFLELSSQLQELGLVLDILASALLQVERELVFWWGFDLGGGDGHGRERGHVRVEAGDERRRSEVHLRLGGLLLLHGLVHGLLLLLGLLALLLLVVVVPAGIVVVPVRLVLGRHPLVIRIVLVVGLLGRAVVHGLLLELVLAAVVVLLLVVHLLGLLVAAGIVLMILMHGLLSGSTRHKIWLLHRRRTIVLHLRDECGRLSAELLLLLLLLHLRLHGLVLLLPVLVLVVASLIVVMRMLLLLGLEVLLLLLRVVVLVWVVRLVLLLLLHVELLRLRKTLLRLWNESLRLRDVARSKRLAHVHLVYLGHRRR